jgi:hypothetical protein
MACTTLLVCLVSTVSGHNKKEAQNALGTGGASSGNITKLEQSRFSFDIYDSKSIYFMSVGPYEPSGQKTEQI